MIVMKKVVFCCCNELDLNWATFSFFFISFLTLLAPNWHQQLENFSHTLSSHTLLLSLFRYIFFLNFSYFFYWRNESLFRSKSDKWMAKQLSRETVLLHWAVSVALFLGSIHRTVKNQLDHSATLWLDFKCCRSSFSLDRILGWEGPHEV